MGIGLRGTAVLTLNRHNCTIQSDSRTVRSPSPNAGRLTLYMDDADERGQPDELLADGVAHYHLEEQSWVALVDWNTIRHASEDAMPSIPESNSINGAQPRNAKATKSQN